MPLSPFDVASREGSTVTVFFDFVMTDVENVSMVSPAAAAWAASEKKTSATPGAGTRIVQVFAFWSHGTVATFSSPLRRPSTSKRPPRVCGMTRDQSEDKDAKPASSTDLSCPGDVVLLRN